MSTATAQAETVAPDPADDRAETCAQEAAREERAAQRAAMLRRLADIGMAMAEALAEEMGEARAAAPDAEGNRPSVAPLSLAYNRVARAVRQSLALEVQLEQGLCAKRAEEEAESFDFAAEADRVRAKVFAIIGDDDPQKRQTAEAAGEDYPSHAAFRWAQDLEMSLPDPDDAALGLRACIYRAALHDGACEDDIPGYVEAARRIWRDMGADPATGPP